MLRRFVRLLGPEDEGTMIRYKRLTSPQELNIQLYARQIYQEL
jgi:hypothetical protein